MAPRHMYEQKRSFVTSRSRLLLDQRLLGSSLKKRHELHFSTRNAFITTQSSCEILPIVLVDSSIIEQRYLNKKQLFPQMSIAYCRY